MQFTTYHPLGVAVEVLEGHLKGSKAFVYFTPKEETTGVTVVGNFKSSTLSDDQLRQEVSSMVENSFNEENAYLKKCLRHVIPKGQEQQEKNDSYEKSGARESICLL
jgi:hypothetical protein